MLKNTKLDFLLTLVAVLGLSVVAGAEGAPPADGTLTVKVSNLQNDTGQIGCSLYAGKDGFPTESEKAQKEVFVMPKARKATCVFEDVKPGTYAVSVMQDLDKNRELKTNMVGRPKEPWGVSNDVPMERFGPPKYEKAAFKYTGAARTIEVKLQL